MNLTASAIADDDVPPPKKDYAPDFVIGGWGVDLKNQAPHRHAYIEHLLRSWMGQRKYSRLWTVDLVKRACKRAKEQRP